MFSFIEHLESKGYKIGEMIGRGAYSQVYDCVKDGVTYAVKINTMVGYGIPSWVLKEIDILTRLRHPSIVGLVDVIVVVNKSINDIHVGIVMEKGESIEEFYIDHDHVRPFVYQMLMGLSFLHVNGVVHSDIKPKNVIKCNDGIRLIDFGICQYISSNKVWLHSNTEIYRPPELFVSGGNHDGTIDPGIDMWALGLTIYEMITGRHLFAWTKNKYRGRNCIPDEHRDFFSGQGINRDDFFNRVNPDDIDMLVDFINKCLRENPRDRLTSKQGLNHPYITGFYPIIYQPRVIIKEIVAIDSPYRPNIISYLQRLSIMFEADMSVTILAVDILDRYTASGVYMKPMNVTGLKTLCVTCLYMACKYLITDQIDVRMMVEPLASDNINAHDVLVLEVIVASALNFDICQQASLFRYHGDILTANRRIVYHILTNIPAIKAKMGTIYYTTLMRPCVVVMALPDKECRRYLDNLCYDDIRSIGYHYGVKCRSRQHIIDELIAKLI